MEINDNTDYYFGVILMVSLFIVIMFILGANVGVYYTEQDIKEVLCRKEYQQTTDYLLCKDKTIEDVLK